MRFVRLTGRLDIALNMAGKIYWSSVLDVEFKECQEAVLTFPIADLLTTQNAACDLNPKVDPPRRRVLASPHDRT